MRHPALRTTPPLLLSPLPLVQVVRRAITKADASGSATVQADMLEAAMSDMLAEQVAGGAEAEAESLRIALAAARQGAEAEERRQQERAQRKEGDKKRRRGDGAEGEGEGEGGDR